MAVCSKFFSTNVVKVGPVVLGGNDSCYLWLLIYINVSYDLFIILHSFDNLSFLYKIFISNLGC